MERVIVSGEGKIGIKFRRQDKYCMDTGEILIGEEIKDYKKIPYEELFGKDKEEIDDIIFMFGRSMF